MVARHSAGAEPLVWLNVEMGPDAMLTGIGGPHVIISPDGTRLFIVSAAPTANSGSPPARSTSRWR